MNEKEMRELDAYLGEHLMGKIGISKDGPRPTQGTEDDYFVREYIHVSESLPRYTTDPAASMMVLKACAKKMSPDGGESAPVVEWLGGVEEKWRVVESDHFDGIESEASTLELAIALFAKKLHAQEKETKVH